MTISVPIHSIARDLDWTRTPLLEPASQNSARQRDKRPAVLVVHAMKAYEWCRQYQSTLYRLPLRQGHTERQVLLVLRTSDVPAENRTTIPPSSILQPNHHTRNKYNFFIPSSHSLRNLSCIPSHSELYEFMQVALLQPSDISFNPSNFGA